MRKLLSLSVLVSLFMITSCAKNTLSLGPSSLKVALNIDIINKTDQSFDKFEFVIWNAGDNLAMVYENIAAHSSSDKQYIDKLNYDFYNSDGKDIYFANKFIGTIDGQPYEYSIGLCGTGLSSKEVNDGTFHLSIESVDLANKRIIVIQSKE